MTMKRAVGYCENTDCEDYAKGVFLLNHGDTFYCPRCRNVGVVASERGIQNAIEGAAFKEVRVEYNYDPINRRFREIGIVRDEAIWGTGSTYTLLSPLIKTEKRALKVAEAILSNLQRYSSALLDDGIPRTTETIISFDEDIEVFTAKMKHLAEEWENSSLVQKPQKVVDSKPKENRTSHLGIPSIRSLKEHGRDCCVEASFASTPCANHPPRRL